MFSQLIELLKLMKLRPATGYGKTIIKWDSGNIVTIVKEEVIKEKDIS